MKRADLKKLIKPIVKECIQESLLEGGVLSKVISEVALGLNSTNTLIKEERHREAPKISEKKESEMPSVMKEQRQKMLDAIGKGSYGGVDLFEGTEPLRAAGTPGQQHVPRSPLGDINPRDPGIDIADLEGAFGDAWRTISNG